MIHNHKAAELDYYLNKLAESKFMFYPTGSRFFGNATEESDYDFFVEDTQPVLTFLENLGFNPLGGNYYGPDPLDRNTRVVMRKLVRDGEYPGAGAYGIHLPRWTHIDIQICKDIYMKQQAQEILSNHRFKFYLVPKSCRQVFWDCIYDALETKKECNICGGAKTLKTESTMDDLSKPFDGVSIDID